MKLVKIINVSTGSAHYDARDLFEGNVFICKDIAIGNLGDSGEVAMTLIDPLRSYDFFPSHLPIYLRVAKWEEIACA